MRSFLFQPLITVRNQYSSSATAPIVNVTQDPESWIELSRYQDGAFLIEVRDVTTANANDSVTLVIETSPTKEDQLFVACTPTITLTASSTPLLVRTTRASSLAPLSRFVRWKLKTNTTTNGAWGTTFRIRMMPAMSPFFMPAQLSGLMLWLRSDLGITLNGSTVSGWADQSGNANNASQGTAAQQPNYSANGGVLGLPKVSGAPATALWMVGSLSPSFTDHTAFVAVKYPSPLANAAAIAGTINNTYPVNHGFMLFTETPTGIIGREANQTGGFSSAVSTDTSSIGSVGIYSTAGSSSGVDLFINGVSKATAGGVTPATQTNYVLLALDNTGSYALNGDLYEVLVYNRVLGSDERTLVHRYLGNRYGVSVP